MAVKKSTGDEVLVRKYRWLSLKYVYMYDYLYGIVCIYVCVN